jgi:isoleucyl-tRNA synthetase
MSKSQGNVIAPQEIIKGFGAEILRIWVSAEDYRDDIRISKEILNRLTEAYRKIRNTCRFLLGNISDLDGGDYSGSLQEMDRWAMSRLQGLVLKVSGAYENYDFHEVFHAIHNFCVVDMSSLYLDILKDRLYTARAGSTERRASQWVLAEILSTLTRLMAPVLSFTAEEVWGYIRGLRAFSQNGHASAESVFFASFPEVREDFVDRDLEERWRQLIEVRDEVNKALEIKRAEKFIGNPLEAKVILEIPERLRALLAAYEAFLPGFFLVSAVTLGGGAAGGYESQQVEGLRVLVERASGVKCQRCWNWSVKVGSFADEPDLCERCYPVVTRRE